MFSRQHCGRQLYAVVKHECRLFACGSRFSDTPRHVTVSSVYRHPLDARTRVVPHLARNTTKFTPTFPMENTQDGYPSRNPTPNLQATERCPQCQAISPVPRVEVPHPPIPLSKFSSKIHCSQLLLTQTMWHLSRDRDVQCRRSNLGI
jgi:hypothetical protein